MIDITWHEYRHWASEEYPAYISYNNYGQCLRASNDLPAGTIVANADLEITNDHYIANHPDPKHRHVVLFAIDQHGKPIWARVYGTMALCNHSCNPNCMLNILWQVVTRRQVTKDEELTIAYDAYIPGITWQDNWTFVCYCNGPNCKKLIDKYRMDIISPVKR
jgi:hypothetical protein